MTKQDFLLAYREELLRRYLWATDEAKLARFMKSVHDALYTTTNKWNNEGEAVNAAWHSIGQKGKPTYKALRTLPD